MVSAQIPTTEPTELMLGDTWTWARHAHRLHAWHVDPDLLLREEDYSWSVTCTSSSGAHLATVLPGAQTNYLPGRYRFYGRVSDGTNSYTVVSGETERAAESRQPRATGISGTKAQRTLEALQDPLGETSRRASAGHGRRHHGDV
jgi:hypothetical protein